jgi:hypothetical protein
MASAKGVNRSVAIVTLACALLTQAPASSHALMQGAATRHAGPAKAGCGLARCVRTKAKIPQSLLESALPILTSGNKKRAV